MGKLFKIGVLLFCTIFFVSGVAVAIPFMEEGGYFGPANESHMNFGIERTIVSETPFGLNAPNGPDPADAIDQLANESSYGYYTNSGEFLFIASGNNLGSYSTLENVESLVESALSIDDHGLFDLTITESISWSSYDGNSGTWETIPPIDAISFYAVKAANAFAMYLVDPAAGSGTWSTYDLWLAGYGGNDGVQISHYTGYNPVDSAPVPEPATMILLGTGLIGIAGFSRKKFFKNK